MDWKKAQLRDFLKLDHDLHTKLSPAARDGAHLALLYAGLRSPLLRPQYEDKIRMNEMAAFRFIRDHADLPLSTDTILRIYGAMSGSTRAGWKTSNVYLETGGGFYVTLPADETPEAMEALCRQYAYLNEPTSDQFDDIFKFILQFICIHPFQDGNGRMSALLLQFLLMKAGLSCACFLPVDAVMNGIFRGRTSRQIQWASGAFYGMKPLDYTRYIPYMKEMIAGCCQLVMEASEMENEARLASES